MKKLSLLLSFVLLASCSATSISENTSSIKDSIDTTIEEETTIKDNTSSSIKEDTTSTEGEEDILFLGNLDNMTKDNVFDYFQSGWSMLGFANSGYLNLHKGNGESYIRTPKLELKKNNIDISIKMHLTNFNKKGENIIGQTLKFSVLGINIDEEFNDIVIAKHTYERVLTQEDYDNEHPYLLPKYSSDFSTGTYDLNLNAKYDYLKIVYETKPEYGPKNGCNLAINEIKMVYKD